MEHWVDIEGYEGLYQVSSQGRVQSVDKYVTRITGGVQHRKSKLMKISHSNTFASGSVGLSKHGKSKTFGLDRLVAKNFHIANYTDTSRIYHIDGNVNNNCVDNLTVNIDEVLLQDPYLSDVGWRRVNIPGLSHYLVSPTGLVRSTMHYVNTKNNSVKLIEGCQLKPNYDGEYFWISLVDAETNKSVSCYIHRIVAVTYIPNPNNLPQINHIDGCKTNNNVANLEWVTSAENVQHAYRIGLAVPDIAHLRALNVPRMKRVRNLIDNTEYKSIADASRAYNINSSTISHWCAQDEADAKIYTKDNKQYKFIFVCGGCDEETTLG